jgi:hypothetical protein
MEFHQNKKESRAHNCEDKTKGLYEDLRGKVDNNPQSPTRNKVHHLSNCNIYKQSTPETNLTI